MELKNYLGITDSYIIDELVKHGFRYMHYVNGKNFGWQKGFKSRDSK